MMVHLKAFLFTGLIFALSAGGYYLSLVESNEQQISPNISTVQPTIPDLNLTSLFGETLNFKRFSGKIIIFNFWASWCTPCIEEVPSLIKLTKSDPNIIIIAVTGDEKKDDVTAFLKSFPGFKKPPIYVVQENAKALMEHFKVDRLPESFIFNPKGEMVKKVTGTINWHTADSLEYFKSLR